MSMPTRTIEVSFNDPTEVASWTDISAYVRAPIVIRRGRQNVLDRFEAGTLDLRLDNRDRRFEPDYASGAYYANVKPLRRVRISATWDGTTYRLFTGYVESWPPSYPFQKDAIASVSAVDGFKVLNLVKLSATYSEELSSVRVANVLDDAVWPAADRSISTGQSTVQAATLDKARALQHLQDVVYSENGRAFIDGEGLAVFQDRHTPYKPPYDTSQGIFGDGGDRDEHISNGGFETAGAGGADLFASWTETVWSGAIVDETVIVYAGSHSCKLTSGSPFSPTVDQNIAVVAGVRYTLTFWTRGDGSYGGRYNVYDVSNSANIIATTDTGVTGTTWTEVSVAFEAPANCETVRIRFLSPPPAEAGSAYFDAVSVVGAELPYSGLTLSYDDQEVWNQVIITREGGTAQTASDATSAASYFDRTLDRSGLLITTDNEAGDAASYLLSRYKDPQLRIPGIEIKPQRDDDLWAHVLGREIGDRVTVLRRPPGGGDAINQDLIIEGIQHDIGRDSWVTRWQLSPADTQAYWILDSLTNSLLDSTTRLAY